MSKYICKIERLANGYEVEVTDPAIAKANDVRDREPYDSKKPRTPWRDPKVCYAFKTVEEVMGFLQKNLDKALPMDEYDSSFNTAVSEAEDD